MMGIGDKCSVEDTSKLAVLGSFCESVFDGFLCWPATKAGTLATQPCPIYNSEQNATKFCEPSGKWYISNYTGHTWTNYTQCWALYDSTNFIIDFEPNKGNSTTNYTWLPVMKAISHVGYWCSLLALLIALGIFLTIKRLQCARNILHMHLFASFIVRIIMYLIKEFLFVDGIALPTDIVYIHGKGNYIKQHYSWECKIVIVLQNYFILANYMLLLMEGVYLHNLIFLNLFSDSSRITVYYCLGWALPLLFIVPWVILRAKFDNKMCWTIAENRTIAKVIQTPIELSVIINFFLFIMIAKLLCIKISSMNIQQRKSKYSRLIRSTLTLILLFGVPYIMFVLVSIFDSQTLEHIWIFYDQVFTSFQGFFVSLIYCLLNNEVQAEIKQKYILLKSKRKPQRSRTVSHTQQFTIPLQDEISHVPQKSPAQWDALLNDAC
ncbi:hypothetical protein Trydic_g7413 [Trypoxylus dichotomus]